MCTRTRIYLLPNLGLIHGQKIAVITRYSYPSSDALPLTDDPDAEYFNKDSKRMENNRHNDRIQSSAKGPIKAYEGKIISNEHRSRFVNFSPCNSDSPNNALHYENRPASYGLD